MKSVIIGSCSYCPECGWHLPFPTATWHRKNCPLAYSGEEEKADLETGSVKSPEEPVKAFRAPTQEGFLL